MSLPQGEWADLGLLRRRTTSLAARIQAAVELFPCEILFVHRDAENQEPEGRYAEIAAAVQDVSPALRNVTTLSVVPVRMQEAWLLFDERSIRVAAGNPNGTESLGLPALAELESIPDPKAVLHEALRRASGLTGRRLKSFEPRRHCFLVAECAAEQGLDPLLKLSAFRRLVDAVSALPQTH